jgi:hypothetical protein
LSTSYHYLTLCAWGCPVGPNILQENEIYLWLAASLFFIGYCLLHYNAYSFVYRHKDIRKLKKIRLKKYRQSESIQSLILHRACCRTCFTIQLMHYSHFNSLNAELNPICHFLVLLEDLTFMGSCILSIFQYISNKMQRYTVYLYLKTAVHVLAGIYTYHQERIQLYLQHLVSVTTFLLSAAIVEELELVWVCTIAADSRNGVTNTRCCRYSCMRSWWWVKVPPETCRAVSRYK